MTHFLDAAGVTRLTRKIKDGTIVAGKANSVPASGITGVIDISHIPQGAQERLVKVANKAARLKLTTSDIQLGDTVQEVDTGVMFIVIDESKLNADAGYQEYTAGTASKASSVPFTGITDKPTTLVGYGISDGVNNVTTQDEGNAVSDLSLNGHTLLKKMASYLQKLTINGVSKTVGKDGALTFSTAEMGLDIPTVYSDTAAATDSVFAIYNDWESNSSTIGGSQGLLITVGGSDGRVGKTQYLLENNTWQTRNVSETNQGTTASKWVQITEMPNAALSDTEIDAAIAAAK